MLRSFLLYLLLEFIPLTIAAVFGMCLFMSWMTGQTLAEVIFTY